MDGSDRYDSLFKVWEWEGTPHEGVQTSGCGGVYVKQQDKGGVDVEFARRVEVQIQELCFELNRKETNKEVNVILKTKWNPG